MASLFPDQTPKEAAFSEIKIAGYSVRFPKNKRPFPAQFGVMNTALKALHSSQNALIESPTGTGKTLALLSACLSWQREHYFRSLSSRRKGLEGRRHVGVAEYVTPPPPPIPADPRTRGSSTTPSAPPINNKLVSISSSKSRSVSEVSTKTLQTAPRQYKRRIYFASRTHSQLSQIMSELKRCHDVLEWTDHRPNAVILGSRKHYCINDRVSSLRPSSRLGNACRSLLETHSCSFAKRAQALTAEVGRLCDIEELISAGRKHKACPYYASQEMANGQASSIVLCPYNYIIDPIIRRSKEIDLDNAVIVFDEGHNIADLLREAASFQIQYETIDEAYRNLSALASGAPNRRHMFASLRDMVAGLRSIVQSTILECFSEGNAAFNKGGNIFSGLDTASKLEQYCGLNESSVRSRRNYYTEVIELKDDSESDQAGVLKGSGRLQSDFVSSTSSSSSSSMKASAAKGVESPTMTENTRSFLNKFLTSVEYFFSDNLGNIHDFRLAITCERVAPEPKPAPRTSNAGRIKLPADWGNESKRRLKKTRHFTEDRSRFSRILSQWSFRLSLWCLSSRVVSKELESKAHSIILASGTLSPLDGLETRLGVSFPHRLEASHVVDARHQVWVGAIGRVGPRQLLGTFQHARQWSYLDDLGIVVLSHLRLVPAGVLCFAPSYSFLSKLVERWKSTGCWRKMNAVKVCLVEAHDKNVKLVNTLKEYKGASKTRKGAILFCVFRGRFSEGVNFSDELCRAVIVIGVPYPNTRDVKLNLIKSSIRNPRERNKWYSSLAFQAVNQAIGRCIRHKDDYGAVLLLDSRYCNSETGGAMSYLSKWIRPHVRVPSAINESLDSIQNFFVKFKKVNATSVPSVEPSCVGHGASMLSELDNPASDATRTHNTFIHRGAENIPVRNVACGLTSSVRNSSDNARSDMKKADNLAISDKSKNAGHKRSKSKSKSKSKSVLSMDDSSEDDDFESYSRLKLKKRARRQHAH